MGNDNDHHTTADHDARGTGAADALWDAMDVAGYLKVSRSWVYQKAEAGLLPALRIGGLLRFEPNTVRDFARGATA